MKLKHYIIIINLAFAPNIFAQLSLGAKAGFNYSDIKISNYSNTNISNIKANSNFGGQFGLFAKAEILKFYIQPEILFEVLKGEILVDHANSSQNKYLFNLNRLSIPIPLGINLGKFSITAGPSANFNLNDGNSVFNSNFDYGNWSFLAGVGFKSQKFYGDLKYYRGLESFSNTADFVFDSEVYHVDMNVNVSVFTFSIGYVF